MQQFNVLDRHLHIHQHFLLEASAGTGKTFSIQNIVVRLLIESDPEGIEPLDLKKILVMTFTRASTRDLKQRIRANIEHAIQSLTHWIQLGSCDDAMADYLVSVTEKGEEAVQRAKKRLQHALFSFDQAQIFTIHGFCARMLRDYALESNTGIQSVNEDETIPKNEVKRVIQDFFRTEMKLPNYSPAQLRIILRKDPDQKQLVNQLLAANEIESYPSFHDLFQRFQSVLSAIRSEFHVDEEGLLEDFQNQAGSYRNYKKTESKPETLAKIKRFASLVDKEKWSVEDFDCLLEDGLVWTQALDPSLLKAKKAVNEKELIYPNLTNYLKKELEPVIQQAGEFPYLLARVAKDCKALLKRYQNEEEKFFPDDFLQKMNSGLSDPAFLQKVQARYQAAIIDEFQDTDPLQWTIFSRLFLPETGFWQGKLYLVGDPKQSIYSFRQADIYTYLEAARLLGDERRFSLDTNYRSQQLLVQALNTLFSSERIPDLIPLPKQAVSLPYRPVKASHRGQDSMFNDDRGALHFFIGDASQFNRTPLTHLEAEIFLPFIAREILRLVSDQKNDWGNCAVLVKDRFQAMRVADYFAEKNIPYVNQRGTSLADSPALFSLIDIIKALLNPRDDSAIKVALGSPLIGWDYAEISSSWPSAPVCALIAMLRETLFEKGFPLFFKELLQSNWKTDGTSLKERLLCQEDGLELYHDLQQIADVVVDCQNSDWNGPEELVSFLDGFQVWNDNDDDKVKRSQNPAQPGVKILTMHYSKGLEFDVVFALGLICRSPIKAPLLPINNGGGRSLAVLAKNDERRREHFAEVDAEKMRQFYVAMTRAKLRLYVPAVMNLSIEGLECGEASPMELFIEKFSDSGKSLFAFLSEKGKESSITHAIEEPIHPSSLMLQNELHSDHLQWSQPSIEIPLPSEHISSFTSLATHVFSGDLPLTASPPHDFNHEEKSPHTLPSGRETGILIHTIMENISFATLSSVSSTDEMKPIINPFIQKTSFDDWEDVIASMVFQALTASITSQGAEYSLIDLMDDRLYKEMPFIFSCEEKISIENIEIKEGFVKGVIDLVFIHEGFYYILDWKTNWLGPDDSYYSKDNLKLAMQKENYFLQAALYKEALKRYVALIDARPFEDCFGGILYFFLRGVQNGGGHGIYLFK